MALHNNEREVRKRIILLIIYAIAMAYLEAMVVVYLRKLVPISTWKEATNYQKIIQLIREAGIMWSEQTREFATIIMLIVLSYLFGRNKRERIAGFLISFGIWDIFYYIFLYIWLHWPSSLFTWDVLFLIPVPWVSPVIIPIIISTIFIIQGSIILKKIKS